MEISINKELISKISNYDLKGGMNLFDVKPTWKDSKFILYPIHLQYINKQEVTLQCKDINYRFVNQSDYKRLKSIFRLLYLTRKLEGETKL